MGFPVVRGVHLIGSERLNARAACAPANRHRRRQFAWTWSLAQNEIAASSINTPYRMTQKLPPLGAIRAFEAAARLGSFTRAAAELDMTQAAISYQIKVLENRLRTPLFSRKSGKVFLTPVGERLLPAVTHAFADLRDAFSRIRESSDNTLSIAATATFAATLLVPRLNDFRTACPDLKVSLDIFQVVTDALDDSVDVGIQNGVGDWPGMVTHRLFSARLSPVCSPQFLQRTPMVEPRDLLAAPLIGKFDPWWRDWFSAAGVDDVAAVAARDVVMGSQYLEGVAAMAGRGVALVMPELFSDDIRAGNLVLPFDISCHEERSVWLLYREVSRHSDKIAKFRNWLLPEVVKFARGS
jgi:LysR family glycine cleavage system transcriptional activator